MFDDDKPSTPKGTGARISLTFDIDFAYNMTMSDIIELGVAIQKAIQLPMSEASRVFETTRYGSRSDKIQFVGIEVKPLSERLWK